MIFSERIWVAAVQKYQAIYKILARMQDKDK